MPAPANDTCAAAEVIGSLPYTASLDNTDATSAGDDPDLIAVGDGSEAGATPSFRTMWYSYTPADTSTVRFTVTDSDVIIGVCRGSCGSLTEVASFPGNLTLRLLANTTYYIVLGSDTDAGHAFDFDVVEEPDTP